MRHFITFTLLFLVAVFLQGCKEEDNNLTGNGDIQFVLDPTGIDGQVQSEDLPEGAYLIVSIQKADGSAVSTRKEVSLVQHGDKLISDPVALPVGDYKLTDFWVVGSGGVMYATPRALSHLAEWVDRPLPFSFAVTNEVLMKEVVQAIDVSASNPADLGYVSFGLDVIRRFGLSVFIPEDDGLALTSGEAFILRDDDTLHIHSLAAQVNTIIFEEEPDESLELVVIKDGYGRYARAFTFNQLKAELKGNPVTAVLAPALTLVADVPDYVAGSSYNFSVAAPEGSLTIDWGDGSSEILPVEANHILEHNYEQEGRYFISIKGDLETVIGLGFVADHSRITRIDLQHLTELNFFAMAETGISPSVMDFTNNKKLQDVTLVYMPELEQIILPAGLELKALDIVGPNNLTTHDMDGVIDIVYQSALQYNTQDGYFQLHDLFTNEMVGPPSAAGLVKLAILRDEYSWFVKPDF